MEPQIPTWLALTLGFIAGWFVTAGWYRIGFIYENTPRYRK